MVKQDLLIQSKGIPVFRYSLLSLLLFFIFSHNAIGQGQIACNDNVQVSLDNDCEAVIRPSMVLEGEGPLVDLLASNVRVRVSGIAPTVPYTHPIVTTPGNYTVTVTNPGGNSCWGKIKVEDKLPPIVDCACPTGNTDPACQFLCTDEAAFLDGSLNFPRPDVTENCVGGYTTTTFDEVIPSTCGPKIIQRTWIFTDVSGNKSIPCVSEYRFTPLGIGLVTPPTNNVSLTCGADVSMQGIFNFINAKKFLEYQALFRTQVGPAPLPYRTIAAADAAAARDARFDATLAAYPTINGVPIIGQLCNIMAAKSDTELAACVPACTNSKKVIRVWTILDWCNGGTRTITQVIKAADEEAPTIQAKDVTVSVDPWTCAANFLLPAPTILHDNCDANPTYKVTGPFGVNIVLDIPSGRYLITGAPKGVHTITYIAKDCCGNEGVEEISLTVLDKTAPIAVAKQNIVISLTTGGENDGIAKLFSNSVDNGSYDSCTPVHLELRREEDPTRDEDGCGYTGNLTYNDDGHPNDGSTNPSSPNYDPDNGAYVKFCCADITNREGAVPFGIVKVWMRVWDDGNMSGVYGDVVNGHSDNYNETWVDVRVEDKLTPQIVCPPAITINCDDDRNNLTLTGKARAFSNCLDLDVEYTDRDFLDNCGIGYIDRTWKIKSRPSVLCVQRITTRNPFGAFTESKITWPRDLTTDCADDAAFRKPTWVAGPCDKIGLNLKSDTFYFEGNSCMKILNRWTVINWCTYDPNATNPQGYFTRTQVIKVVDDEKPVLSSCSDLMFEINDNSDVDNDGNRCEIKNLVLTKVATDQGQCASDWLKWIVFVDLWGDGTNDYEYSSFLPANDATFNDTNGNGIKDVYVAPTGQGGEVKVTLPEDIVGNMSNHKVTWKVIDGCGNVTTCDQNFMVVDKKKPTPYCQNVSSALMINGKVELWAVDLNVGSFDNCTSKQNLLYTFDEANPVLTRLNQIHFFKGAGLSATQAEYNAGTAQQWLPAKKSSGKIFDCDDLPSVDVKMTVWDEKLNYDFCVVSINLADNQDACGERTTTTVSGRFVSNAGKNVQNTEVILDNGIAEMLATTSSNSNGDYMFQNAVTNYSYNISGKKNDDYLNGVSTLDLVLIQRHVLGSSKFDSPYNMIAADVNNDQKVTASDLVELRKLILGIYTSLPKNDSWRFLNNTQTFVDINNPWPFEEKIHINNLSHQMTEQNFVSVKIGDVNGSAAANLNDFSTGSRSKVALKVEDQKLSANTKHTAKFSVDLDKIYGAQFTFSVHNAELGDIYIGGQKLMDQNIAQVGDHTFTLSWNDLSSVSGTEWLTIDLVAQKDILLSDVISINSSVTSSEVYSGDNLNTHQLSLNFDDQNEFEMFQNEPNPFMDRTTISFNLPIAGDATLKVFDVNGQLIYKNTRSFEKGIQSFLLSKGDLPSTGVMVYQIESGSFTSTKKMIGLE